ncbi:MAG: helix-hairpin-helix domain-containing protein [Flavitalea sp.]
MVSNREISRLFNLHAELLLLHNKNEDLANLLSGAAYRLRNINEELLELDNAQLSKLFRPEIIQILKELKKAGTINDLDELIQLTPPGLFEMMRIRGLGGKKLSILWRIAKIDTVDALLDACKKNELTGIPGFGLKTQQNIIHAIEADRSNRDRFHYATVADDAKALVLVLQKAFNTKLVSLCGEVRRQTTTVEQIEIIAAIDSKKFKGKDLRRFMVLQSSGKTQTNAQTLDEIPITVYHTSKEKFHLELFERTGSKGHVEKMITKGISKGSYTSEEAMYKAARLPFIVPEMREDVAEWNFGKKVDSLISMNDIKGVVHNHTTWSDGVDRLDDFVNACKKRGYEYVVISDHSKNAHYAGGLKEEKVIQQFKEIDMLNKTFKSFRIFKSIECDILVSGELDFGDNLLKQFDMVIVSVHQLLKMDEDRATKRLIKAIENPYTTILGHMTGRQLLIRPGYPVNFKKVIDACAANQVVIEINANPYRLDMDWSHIPYAIKKGVMISINPDAHSIAEIDNIRWGVSAARKGGLTRDMTWNAMPLREIEKWLKK